MANRTAQEYLLMLQALLPSGAAWPHDATATLTKLLQAWADELARVDGRTCDLIDENDPRSTLEMLTDWERAFGLPEPCIAPPDTIAERRLALHEKVTRIGGQSRAYFIDLAGRLGFVITITEFSPHTVAHVVNYPLYGRTWVFAWRVNAPEETVIPFRVNGGVNEPLADWGNEILECVLTRLKPAHTHVQFAYGG